MEADKTFHYQKIKDYIISNIEKDVYQKNKIESENELSALFHTSRMTVRQALSSLQEEGYIYTIAKKGSYVSKVRPVKQLDGLRSFTEDVGKPTKSKVLFVEKKENSIPQIEAKYVWHIGRVRYAGNQPIAYEEGYFNGDIIATIETKTLESSIYQYIENTLQYRLDYATQEIVAIVSNDISKILGIEKDTPLLKITQTTYLSDNQCIEYCDTYYRSDMYCFRQNAYRGGRKR